MSSCKSSKFRMFLIRFFPFLFKVCPGKNYHWKTDKFCRCLVSENVIDSNGGSYGGSVYCFVSERFLPKKIILLNE